MKIYKIALPILLLLMVGCATTEPVPVDYDPDEIFRVHSITGKRITDEPTPAAVEAANMDGVVIDVKRLTSFWDDQYNVEVQSWNVYVTNTNSRAQCVGVVWRLLDFQFITEYPTTLLVPAETRMLLGEMLGETMVLDGVLVAPPPSGYVHGMQVVGPDWQADEGFECQFLAEEDEVEEQ